MRRVVIETPYSPGPGGTIEERSERLRTNIRYLRAALHDSICRGEAPFASHAIYTQKGVLDDDVPDQREHGIAAGFAWGDVADAVVVYEDLGVSGGMERGMDRAYRLGQKVEHRTVPGWSDTP